MATEGQNRYALKVGYTSAVSSERALHPELTPDGREDLVRAGVEHFNAGRFFAAHEAWEEVWRSTTPEPRELWRGLIQVAVGLYHFVERANPGPARRVLGRGLARVDPYPQGTEGLDLERFRAGARAWLTWLEAPAGEPPTLPRLDRLPDVE